MLAMYTDFRLSMRTCDEHLALLSHTIDSAPQQSKQLWLHYIYKHTRKYKMEGQRFYYFMGWRTQRGIVITYHIEQRYIFGGRASLDSSTLRSGPSDRHLYLLVRVLLTDYEAMQKHKGSFGI
jgi:hypothetical protein